MIEPELTLDRAALDRCPTGSGLLLCLLPDNIAWPWSDVLCCWPQCRIKLAIGVGVQPAI
jgi:hypothetical protein